jgi:anaerobic magnesium-protoporphyrin IX monomethyl ester cyclase
MTRQIKKITCIQLGGEFPDFCYRLVMPDYGLPVIGTILAEAGYDVKVYMEHIEPPEWDRIAGSDLVCFSSLNAGADKTYRLAQEIRSELEIPTIIGGTHATYFPDSCLQYCDYVVFGEGDETIVELVETLAHGGDVDKVAGVAYRMNGQVHRTAPRSEPPRFDTVPNFSLIEGYPRMSWLDMLLQRRKPQLTAQSSRGCQFKCTFCIVNTMFPTGYRKRDVESVIRDLRDKRQYGRELMFVDNDFAALRPYTKKLLRRMIEEDFGFDIVVFARVEVTKDDEILSLMRQAGITQIYQGYESVQPETLVAYNKHQTFDQIVAAIEKIHSFGFRILGSFVVGADTDTPETIERTVNFVLEQKLALAYFFPIWGHFPEQLNGYHTIVPWYRSIFRAWRYCDGNFVSHFPLHMPPSRLQQALIDAHRAIYSPTQVMQALQRGKFTDAKGKILHRYVWRDIEKGLQEHIAFLEELEDGLYDANGHLREDLLIERVQRDPRWTFQAGNRTIETLGLSPLELPIPGERNITCMPPKLGSGHAHGVDAGIHGGSQ